jgi:hypothetical protein
MLEAGFAVFAVLQLFAMLLALLLLLPMDFILTPMVIIAAKGIVML